MSLDDLSLPSVSFSSEVGEVLNFFAYFFVSRQKSMWGMGPLGFAAWFTKKAPHLNNI
jgi:hypothetical protein